MAPIDSPTASTVPSASSAPGHALDPRRDGPPLIELFAVRGALAITWAIAFAGVSDSLTTGAGVLLVAYPLIDVIASLVDSRGDHTPDARRLLRFDAALSTLAALSLVVAATGSVPDVLHVFGTWAVVAGVTQIVVAVRRRAELGVQVPMLIAGTLSTLVGVFYNVAAAGDDPKLDPLVAYAAAGGAFFVIQAGVLAVRRRRADRTTNPAV